MATKTNHPKPPPTSGSTSPSPKPPRSPRAHATASGITRRQAVQELTRSSLALVGQLSDYNPDDLVISKGDGIRIYQDMLRDPYVKAALGIKKIAVSKLPKHILPASESARDQEIAKFVEWNLENMETPIDNLLWGVLDCVDVGYSIGEMNFRVIPNGPFKGMFGLSSIKSKDPYYFTFELDDFGNIKAVFQRLGGRINYPGVTGPYGSDTFPPEKFVVMSFQPKYSNPYGTSDLRAAYRAFFIKDWAWKFRSIYMEKFGMPPIIGRFPNGTPEARRIQLEKVLESIQNETVMTIPEDLQIEVLKIALEGRTTEYERAIADLNKEILIGILGSFLSVEEGKRTGARAQGQVHFQVSTLFVEHLACALQETMNRQIVRRLVDLNYTTGGSYPTWVFDVANADRLIKELDIDQTLVNMGVPLENKYFYDKYQRPTPSETAAARTIGPDRYAEFERLRAQTLPEDSKKIAELRDFYQFYIRLDEARTGRAVDVRKVAYEIAGEEREYWTRNQKWRDPQSAFLRYNELLDQSNVRT